MKYDIKITLKEVLAERGKTRYWLSQKTGIHYKTIDSYYKNKIQMAQITLENTCRYLLFANPNSNVPLYADEFGLTKYTFLFQGLSACR